MVYQLAYVSAATGGVERNGLIELLRAARSRNQAAGVTGVLLYRQERFLQLLEGSAPAVGEIYRSIAADRRHTDVRCVQVGHSATRWFSEWSMGFRDLTDTPLATPGYVNLLTDTAPDPDSAALYELWHQLQPTPATDSRPSAAGPALLGTSRGASLTTLRDNIRRGLLRAALTDSDNPHPA